MADSTISFFAAFGLEVLLFSNELWARLPAGIVLVVMVLLISWCVWTMLEARVEFSLLGGVHALKGGLVDFTRRLQGKTSGPGSDEGYNGDSNRKGALKEAFNRRRRQQGHKRSTSSLLVHPTWNTPEPPNATLMEMGEIITEEPRSVV